MINMWIFQSAILDILFFVMPVLSTVALFMIHDIDLERFAIAGIIIFTWIDSGHVFTTVLRTYMHPDEYQSNKKVYIYAPIAIFLIMWSWLMLGGYLIWDFIMYITIYHNVRQFYGVTRWYQKNVASKSLWQTRFLYILTLIPVLLFHFRTDIPKSLYGKTDLMSYDNAFLLYWGLWVYFAVVSVWLMYQAVTLIKNKYEFAVGLSVLVPAIGYGYGFLYGQSVFQIAAPIIAGHGIAYLGLMSLSLNRTRAEKYKSFIKVLLLTVVIAILAGSVSDVVEDNYLGQYMFGTSTGWSFAFISFALAIVFTPLLLHYYVDALIWSGKHRESHLVYKPKS